MVERKIKFVFGFQQMVPFLGYHHVLMLLILVAIIILCTFRHYAWFLASLSDSAQPEAPQNHPDLLWLSALTVWFTLALLLAGCSSSSVLIPSIFLVNMWYDRGSPTFDPAQVDPATSRSISNMVGNADLETRVGYFGICVNPDGGSWLCSANASSLAAQIPVDQDPLNLIWVAQTFRESIVFPYLIIIAIILATVVLLLLATFPGHEEEYEDGVKTHVRRLPSRAVSQISLAIIFVSAIFVLVSVLWQHTASVAAATIAQNMGNGSVGTGVGVTAMVLGWFGFALLIIVTIGLLVMILSMHLVEKLTEDDGEL